MTMSESILVKGRNQETARALLDSAKRLGLGPEVVQTSSLGGYLVPKEVFEGLGDAPGEDFTESVEIRTQALASDEVADEGPDSSPSGLAFHKHSGVGEDEGGPQRGPGLAERPVATADAPSEEEDGGDEQKTTKRARRATPDRTEEKD